METKAFYIKRLLSTLGICLIGLILSKTVFAILAVPGLHCRTLKHKNPSFSGF